MVEAAMIFPLVILTVTALMLMLAFFYRQVVVRTDMHMALRAECGQLTDTLRYSREDKAQFAPYRRGDRLYCRGTVTFTPDGILKGRSKELEARKYLLDEADFVRLVDLAEWRDDDEEQ